MKKQQEQAELEEQEQEQRQIKQDAVVRAFEQVNELFITPSQEELDQLTKDCLMEYLAARNAQLERIDRKIWIEGKPVGNHLVRFVCVMNHVKCLACLKARES
jgi:hypothetical protein